jgi:hypothetical protein
MIKISFKFWLALMLAGLLVGVGVIAYAVNDVKKHNPPNTETATVYQYDGLYTFVQCFPVMRFDSIGLVTPQLNYSPTPHSLYADLVRQTKSKYPKADGIVTDLNFTRAVVIEFR